MVDLTTQFTDLPPEVAQDYQAIQRRRAIADMIAKQSLQPIQAPPSTGRFAVPVNPLQVVAQALSARFARQGQEEGDKALADLGTKYKTKTAEEMQKYQQTRQGTPAQVPEAIPEALPEPPATPAVPGNPRAAVAQAMLNPYLKHNPLVQADLKKIEPNWQVHKQYDPSGHEKEVLVDLNNPTDPSSVKPFGGTKAEEMHFVDAGGSVIPVPKTSTKPIPKTPDPNRVGDPASIEANAKGIASGQLPPLSGFASKTPIGVQIMARVLEINPTYDAADFNTRSKTRTANEVAFTKGKQSDTLRAINVAHDHLDTWEKAATALHNGDTQGFNKLAAYIGKQFGVAAPTTLEAMAEIVGPEVIKGIVPGGGGVEERTKMVHNLGVGLAPGQQHGTAEGIRELLMGQAQGLKRQYLAGGGTEESFNKKLSQQLTERIAANDAARKKDKSGTVLRFDAQGNPIP
jgi:hypothetical protein